MGDEVLWVIQGEMPVWRTAAGKSVVVCRHQRFSWGTLLKQVKQMLQLPIAGVISDGQQSIRHDQNRI